jgi:serine/threonine protein phosphatase 1
MGKKFVIGDIHGAHIPLKQCLERCGFNKENDLLITLGDICDGWPYVYECVEELLTIKNRIDIIGNHDEWFIKWWHTMEHPDYWSQGGKGTVFSYLRGIGKEPEITQWVARTMDNNPVICYNFNLDPMDINAKHITFFKGQHLYFKDDKNRLFVHAGLYDRFKTLKENQRTNPSSFYWDRTLWNKALSVKNNKPLKFAEEISEVFIGHTSTLNWTYDEKETIEGIIIPGSKSITTPMQGAQIWNLDTGAGSTGKLTIMDIDTKEYWQSDLVSDIYAEYKPRG